MPGGPTSGASPKYSVDSGNSGSGAYSGYNTQSPAGSSAYNANSMYIPASPAYNPASSTPGGPTYMGGSPIAADEDEQPKDTQSSNTPKK